MGIISILLLIVFVISSLLLVLLVMLQGESGDELGGLFGGGMNQQMGMRSGNILTKITTILGAIFFLSAFGVAWVNRTPSDASIESTAREFDERVEWWVDEATTNENTEATDENNDTTGEGADTTGESTDTTGEGADTTSVDSDTNDASETVPSIDSNETNAESSIEAQ